jgi:SAM-dependent methyltransferase
MTPEVRGSAGAAGVIDALDAVRAIREIQRHKRRLVDSLPERAARILDVGCGTGDDVLALAERYGSETQVVGLERSTSLVEEAERRARAVALSTRFVVGDAHEMPFADGEFDVVVADQVLVHVADPELVLLEMARVTRRGGTVVVHERDAASVVCDSLLSLRGGSAAAAVTLGRRLRRLLNGAGLRDVIVADVSAWLAQDVATAERLFGLCLAGPLAPDPGFVAAGLGFTVRGRKRDRDGGTDD